MKTKEQFIEKAKEIHGDKYDYSLIKYTRLDRKVKIVCPIHGEFEQTPIRHLKSKGCPKCGRKQKTKEQFIEKAKEIHGDKYDYSEVNYIDDKTKVKIICPIHGEFYKRPNEHLSEKAGCPKCSQENQNEIKHNLFKKTAEQFIKEAKKIHGDKYDYSKVDYYNTHTKVKIICPIHGEFEQTPKHHLEGSGCPECAIIKKAKSRLNNWEDVLKRMKNTHGDKYDYSKAVYEGINKKIEIICPKHGSFWMSPENHCNGKQDCPKCMLGISTSKQEKSLGAFLNSLNIKWEKDRDILNGKELDIYIPDLKIAIEYDGIYWHNNVNNYFKYEECRKKGIRLIQITEWEWYQQREKIENYLKDTLTKKTIKIYARKCEIREIDTKTYKNFCVENHLQGYGAAAIKIGLFYNNELIQIMSFSKARFKKYEYEMIRECSKNGYTIIGGKSKLLKYFEKTYKPKNLVSYCEKNKFSGDSYLKLGFKLDRESQPGYNYYKGKSKYNRLNFQKHKLKNLLENFDENLSEWENMKNNGYKKLFDYGNFVFIKEYKYD